MTYKVLYAEDEPFLSRIICDNLIAKGYDVITAGQWINGAKVIQVKNSRSVLH